MRAKSALVEQNSRGADQVGNVVKKRLAFVVDDPDWASSAARLSDSFSLARPTNF
jgi:hypothetical protein